MGGSAPAEHRGDQGVGGRGLPRQRRHHGQPQIRAFEFIGVDGAQPHTGHQFPSCYLSHRRFPFFGALPVSAFAPSMDRRRWSHAPGSPVRGGRSFCWRLLSAGRDWAGQKSHAAAMADIIPCIREKAKTSHTAAAAAPDFFRFRLSNPCLRGTITKNTQAGIVTYCKERDHL